LLTPDTFSVIHRVKSDEVFHFYAGDAIEMLQLWTDGTTRCVLIHNDLAAGHEPQVIVPAGVWQGCRLVPGGTWALLGCTVAPGFDYADYTPANRAELLAAYPQFEQLITALTAAD
jgi:predicted cupin superfamily sugar epimerase